MSSAVGSNAGVVGGDGIAIRTAGSGPDLVLLHGWAMHGGVFAPLLPALAARFTVHVVDLPGHGDSRAATTPLALAAVVDALAARLPPAIWMGWSLGGLFAMHAALALPGRVQGLVALCASPRFVRGDGDWPYGVSAEIFRDFGSGLRDDYRGTLDRFVALEAFGSDDARAAVRSLRNALFARGEPAAAALSQGLALLETVDLRDRLPALQVPSLWLSGRRDRLVDPRAMRLAQQMTPGAQAVQLEHAGHAPFLTHPDDVAAHVMAFAESLEGIGMP